MRLLKPEHLQSAHFLRAAPIITELTAETQEPTVIEVLWQNTRENDNLYHNLYHAIKEERHSFPLDLGVKVSIIDYTLDNQDNLRYHSHLWVPNSEPLHT